MLARYKFEKFDADYFQFHLKDSGTNENLSAAWTKDSLLKNLAVEKHIIGIGTQRDTTVCVILEIFNENPETETDLKWRQVLESELSLPSGVLILTSPTLEQSQQQYINFIPGSYNLKIYYGDKNSRGRHIYKIVFWRI